MKKIIKRLEIKEELVNKINYFLLIDDLQSNYREFEELGFSDGLTIFEKYVKDDEYSFLLTVNKGSTNGWIDFSVKRHSDDKWFDSEPIFYGILGEYTINIEDISVTLDVVAA